MAQHRLQPNPWVNTKMQAAVQLHEGFVKAEWLHQGYHRFQLKHALVEHHHGRQQWQTGDQCRRFGKQRRNVASHLFDRTVWLDHQNILQQPEQKHCNKPSWKCKGDDAHHQAFDRSLFVGRHIHQQEIGCQGIGRSQHIERPLHAKAEGEELQNVLQLALKLWRFNNNCVGHRPASVA